MRLSGLALVGLTLALSTVALAPAASSAPTPCFAVGLGTSIVYAKADAGTGAYVLYNGNGWVDAGTDGGGADCAFAGCGGVVCFYCYGTRCTAVP